MSSSLGFGLGVVVGFVGCWTVMVMVMRMVAVVLEDSLKPMPELNFLDYIINLDIYRYTNKKHYQMYYLVLFKE